MDNLLNVLIIEDSDDDALLILRELKKGGFKVSSKRVETQEDMINALGEKDWNLILADYIMPRFSGIEALKIFKEKQLDIPFLIVSGKIGENVAVEAMRMGAHDYILKDNLQRLVPAVKRELTEAATRRKQKIIDDELHHIQRHLSNIIDSLDLAVWSYDVENEKFVHVSSGIRHFFGFSAEQFLEDPLCWKKVVPKGDFIVLEKAMDDLLIGQPVVHEFRVNISNNRIKWLEQHIIPVLTDGKLKRANGIIMDVTQRKHYEAQIMQQAYYDPLTMLPNRLLLNDRFNMAVSLAKRKKANVSLFFIDIDRFKNVNDTLGHKIGDMLLREISVRLQESFREIDTITRHGGDEFLILLPEMSREQAEEVAQRTLKIISTPFYFEGVECNVTSSIGIAIYPDDGANITTLIQHADQAMYLAKELGKNMFKFYSKDINKEYEKRSMIERELHSAIKNNHLQLFFQPQFEINTAKLIGLEALIRWKHKKMGWIPPSEFIPVAEKSGLIRPLGKWILERACEQSIRWQKANLPPVRIAVNLAAKQFNSENIVKNVSSILSKTGLSPHHLELEITESMAMNIDYTLPVLKKLKRLGINISIDDFGTGYSSLKYITKFPIDRLKIDQSFVSKLGQDSENNQVVGTIISMARLLNFDVIAEGVETKQQLKILTSFGCNQAQGYYYSKPMTVTECTDFLKTY